MVIKCVVASGNECCSSVSVVAVNSTACSIKQRLNTCLHVNLLLYCLTTRDCEMMGDFSKLCFAKLKHSR